MSVTTHLTHFVHCTNSMHTVIWPLINHCCHGNKCKNSKKSNFSCYCILDFQDFDSFYRLKLKQLEENNKLQVYDNV